MLGKYHVEIQTEDIADAGTDSNISVEFTSTRGHKSGLHLLDNDGNDFERNYNDFYPFDGLMDPDDPDHNLASVTIKHDGKGLGSGWKMEWLKVTHCGKTWKATTKDWINNESKTLTLSPSVGRINWMSVLNDTDRIDQLNIPGTHDSGTSYLASGKYHRTQNLNIQEQLLLGIRYFDIRLSCIVNPNWKTPQPISQRANFTIHHEKDWCKLYFDQDSWVKPDDVNDIQGYVLQDFLNFLKENPSEFILLQVQREHNDEQHFGNYFKAMLDRHDLYNNFLFTNFYPTYQQAKGKIVIISMNHALLPVLETGHFASEIGITLKGPKLINTPAVYLENHWMDSNKELKWEKVEAALKMALQNHAGQWVITFVSDGSGALAPSEFAKYLNAWVENFIKINGESKHYGTILLDFPTRSLVGLILKKYIG